MPRWLCLWQVLNRRIEYRNKQRPDLPEGCQEKLNLRYIFKVLIFPLRGRRLYFKKKKEIEISQRCQKEKTNFLTFKSLKGVEYFLQAVAAHLLEDPTYKEQRQVSSVQVENPDLVPA